jgi:sugar lactone lactonase YvrE
MKIFEYTIAHATTREWLLPYMPSVLIPDINNDSEIFVGVQGGMIKFNLNTGAIKWLVDIEINITNNRTNDGSMDCNGRIWIGTMGCHCERGRGSLYCIDKNLEISKKISGLTISNGIAWNKNNTILYHIDSAPRTINAYRFDASSGDIQFLKTVVQVPSSLGLPDGMCIDKNGMLWVAHWNGHGVYCWNPETGNLIKKIELPAAQVTSCKFNEPAGDKLYSTTARQGLSQSELEACPLSGALFEVSDLI